MSTDKERQDYMNTAYPPPHAPGYSSAPPQAYVGQYGPGSYPTNQGYGDPYAPQGVITSQPTTGQTVVVQVPAANLPNDYLTLNIFTCLCCCWIIGIFGIIKSSQCRDAKERGDVEEAWRLSKTAKNLALAAFIIGIFCTAAYIALYVLRASLFYSSDYTYYG